MPSWKINCLKSEVGIVLPTISGKKIIEIEERC
jgi:hypothetical protein